MKPSNKQISLAQKRKKKELDKQKKKNREEVENELNSELIRKKSIFEDVDGIENDEDLTKSYDEEEDPDDEEGIIIE